MAGEQIQLINVDPMPQSKPSVETMDLYLVVAWRAIQWAGVRGVLTPCTRSKIEQFSSPEAAQRCAAELAPNWPHRAIYHVVIGGE